MGDGKEMDYGARVRSDLEEIYRTFRVVDEAYRRFRALLLQDPPKPESLMPVEWIAISNQ